MSLRKNLDIEEYKRQADFFLQTGVDHYLVRLDKNFGPKALESMRYFHQRWDLECTSG